MSLLALAALGVLLHSYLGYPLSLLLLRAWMGRRSRHRTGEDLPTVTLVISAYNEEGVIRAKVENALALDYPGERIRRIVVSDGSTDRTETIVAEYERRGVELRSFEGRQGKVACLNRVLPHLTTDLVVMSDANSIYEADGIRRLVRHFADERVGCVCGQLEYVNPRRLAAGEGETAYWRYETLVKIWESDLGSLLGANGAIYAFRTPLFRPVDPLTFCDDVIPIRIAIDGRLTLFDPTARCTEEAPDESVQMNRRRRHASFGLRSMLQAIREATARRRPLIVYQCLSHRVLRWMGGPALLVLLVGSFGLEPVPRRLLLGGQLLFYGAGLLGFLASRLRRGWRFLYLPYYFLAAAGAGLSGLLAFIARTDRPYWEPRR